MKQPFSFLIILAVSLIACHQSQKQSTITAITDIKTKDSILTKPKPASSKPSLKDQLYLFAPELDTKNCIAAGSCDCCSWNILFHSDTSFTMIDYCEASYTYFKGSYTFNNNLLTLHFSNRSVEKIFNEASITTGEVPEYTYKVNSIDASTMSFIRQHCNGDPIFKGNNGYADYGVVDRKRNLNKLLQYMKEEGVWQKLQLP